MYEVELKFPVNDVSRAWHQLAQLGAIRGRPVSQADQYFAHPCRSFVDTDEALRIRSIGDLNTLTYKGPVIDTLTKMRREIEVDFATGPAAAGQLGDILHHLGFQPVRVVAKTRWSGSITWDGVPVGWTWDDVPPLGTFVELELVVTEAERDAARDRLCRLADHLQLGTPEPRSYLELLLQHDSAECQPVQNR